MKLSTSRTLFIDDVQKNVDAAKAQGMQAVRFVDEQQLRQALAGFELLNAK